MADVEFLLKLAAEGGKQTQKEIELVERSLAQTRAEIARTDKTFSQFLLETNIDGLADDIQDASNRASRLASELESVEMSRAVNQAETLADELTRAGRAADSIDVKRVGGGGRGGLRTESAGQVLSGLSQVSGVGGLQTGADFVGLVGDSKEAIAGLREAGVALAPLGVAGFAVAGAFALLAKADADASSIINERIEAGDERLRQLRLESEVDKLSADQIRERLGATRTELTILHQARDEQAQAFGASVQDMTALSQGVAGLRDAVGVGGAFETAKANIEEYNQKIIEQENNLKILNAELEQKILLEKTAAAASEGEKIALGFVQTLKEAAEVEAAIANSDLASLQDLQAAQLQRIENDKQIAAGLNQYITDNTASISEFQAAGGFDEVIADLVAQNAVYQTELDALAGSTADATRALEQINPELDTLTASTNRLLEVQQRLTAAQQESEMRLASTQRVYLDAVSQRERAEQQLANQQEQLLSLETERAQQLQRQSQTEALKAAHDAQLKALDVQVETAEKQAEIASIQKDAATKQTGIANKLASDTTSAFNKMQADVQKLNSDFMKSELRAIQDFNLSQKRLREDTEADLIQAALDNDVNAFLSARDSAVTQLGRNDEDFGIERERAEAERQARLAELNTTYEAERQTREAAAQVELTRLQTETQQKLLVTQQGGENELAVVRQLEERKRQLLEVHEQQTSDLQARFAQADYDARVAALSVQYDATREGYEALARETANMAVAVGRAAARGFFEGAQSNVDASIRVAINQGLNEFSDAAFGGN